MALNVELDFILQFEATISSSFETNIQAITFPMQLGLLVDEPETVVPRRQVSIDDQIMNQFQSKLLQYAHYS